MLHAINYGVQPYYHIIESDYFLHRTTMVTIVIATIATAAIVLSSLHYLKTETTELLLHKANDCNECNSNDGNSFHFSILLIVCLQRLGDYFFMRTRMAMMVIDTIATASIVPASLFNQ